jgi:hypothetical protein
MMNELSDELVDKTIDNYFALAGAGTAIFLVGLSISINAFARFVY